VVIESIWTRRDILQRSALAAGFIAAPGVFTACAKTGTGNQGGRLQQLKQTGTITVGIAGEEPYAYLAGGKLTGEEPEVHKEIWKNLGIDNVKATQVDFDSLIPGLTARRFDVVAAGMFVTPKRCAQASFSEPIYCAPNAFLVRTGNPKNLSDFKSVAVAGVKLAVLGGAVEGTYARENGVKDSNVIEVGSPRDGLLQVQQGRVAALGLTTITLNNLLKKNPTGGVEVTKPFTPVVGGKEQLGCGAAVFRKEDNELRDAFNAELAKLKESGRLTEIVKPFGFGPETLPAKNITTAKLCQG
jgi:polar amino acid transport system substrate-binding protein